MYGYKIFYNSISFFRPVLKRLAILNYVWSPTLADFIRSRFSRLFSSVDTTDAYRLIFKILYMK
jgi:hypothetical protein